MFIGPSHFQGQPAEAVEDALWLATEPFPEVRGDLPDDIANRVIAILRPVVARRAAGAGAGIASETVGPFSRTYATHGVDSGLSKAEREALRRIGGALLCNPKKRVARTIPLFDGSGCKTC